MDINELTYQIRGAVFEVNRMLRAGFLRKSMKKRCWVLLVPWNLCNLSDVAADFAIVANGYDG